MNWALRNIGKRNIDLQKKAIKVAQKIQVQENKSGKWIAANAIKELESSKVNILEYPRDIYRTVNAV